MIGPEAWVLGIRIQMAGRALQILEGPTVLRKKDPELVVH